MPTTLKSSPTSRRKPVGARPPSTTSFSKGFMIASPIIRVAARRVPLGQNIRIGIVSPYIVIYRNDDVSNTVTVLRIVHGRRRISGRMLGSA
jgi:hypothetical protein